MTSLSLLCRAWERLQAGTHATAYLALDRPCAESIERGTVGEEAWCALLRASASFYSPTAFAAVACALLTSPIETQRAYVERAIKLVKAEPDAGKVTTSCATVAWAWVASFEKYEYRGEKPPACTLSAHLSRCSCRHT